MMEVKSQAKTDGYKEFIDDFDIEFGDCTITEEYNRKEDITTKHCEYQVKLTYKPNNKFLTFTLKSYVYNNNFKLTKEHVVDELKRNATFLSIGEWKRVVDHTGEWYYNDVLDKGDVTKTKLALWNEHKQILKTLLGNLFDKFISV